MLYTKRSHIHFGTVRAYTFFLNNLFKDSRGTVRAFEINQLNAKTVFILNTVQFALLTFLAGKR